MLRVKLFSKNIYSSTDTAAVTFINTRYKSVRLPQESTLASSSGGGTKGTARCALPVETFLLGKDEETRYLCGFLLLKKAIYHVVHAG